MDPLLDRDSHQLVIGGMEAHEIDAPPVAIVGVEFRRMAVGERAEFEIVGRPGARAEGGEIVERPGRAFARDALLQRRVAVEEVVVGERDGLVEDLMGRERVFREIGHEILRTRGGFAELKVRSVPALWHMAPLQQVRAGAGSRCNSLSREVVDLAAGATMGDMAIGIGRRGAHFRVRLMPACCCKSCFPRRT